MSRERIMLRRRRDLSQIIESAFAIYTQNFPQLFVIAAIVIPLGIANAALQPVIDDDATLAAVSAGFTLADAVVSILAAAAIIAALQEIDAGRPVDFSRAFDAAFTKFGSILGAVLRVVAHVALFAITIVGIPWAIQRIIRWLFITQAVIFDGTSAKAALSYSADAVIGRWWYTLGVAAVIWIITVVPVTVVSGVLLLAPPIIAGTISSAVNAALLPFGVTAATLLYLDLKVRKETDIHASAA